MRDSLNVICKRHEKAQPSTIGQYSPTQKVIEKGEDHAVMSLQFTGFVPFRKSAV
jgi:hypothetical protein